MSVSPDIAAGGVAVLVGNPVPGSRAAVVATALAEGLLGSASEPAALASTAVVPAALNGAEVAA